jgi:hypothetical protein
VGDAYTKVAGSVRDVMRMHEDVVVHGRHVVVLETNNTKLEKYFVKVAKEMHEKYTAVIVTQK